MRAPALPRQEGGEDGVQRAPVTAFAVPVPSAPEFDTFTVNPIGSPVLTGVASAVLRIARSGQFTVSNAGSESEPSLAVVTVAVLLYAAQLVLDVAAVRCTVRLAPDAKLIG